MTYNFINTLVNEKIDTTEKLKPYSYLIGDWYFQWIGYNEDGTTWEVPGQWHFSWILNGKAIQDNWICPRIDLKNIGGYPNGEYGTTIRFYDKNDDKIKIIWVGPEYSSMKIFEAKSEDGKIIQTEYGEIKQQQDKWIFTEIKEKTFKWEAYKSNDYGLSWFLEQEVCAERKIT